MKRKDNTVVHAPGLALVFAPPREVTIEPGWVAPRYGAKEAAPVVSAMAENAAEAVFFTLAVPLASHGRAPRLSVENDPASGMALRIEGVGPDSSAVDTVAWRLTPSLFRFGPFHCQAKAAWRRETTTGEPLCFRACGIVSAEWAANGEPVPIRETAPASWLTWEASTCVTFDTGGSL
jgi:hypothetical protein